MLDHRAAMLMLVLFSCFLFLTTHAQQQPQAAVSGNRKRPSCIPQERDALLAFKHRITSDPAGLLDSWRRHGGHGEHDCCQWRGVRCSNRTGHVHELRLGGTFRTDYLVGQISPFLLALDHLEHLDLSWNILEEGPTGRIPEFLGSLKTLKYLNLSGIPFYGRVPPQLGNLSRLQYLDLSHMGDTNSMDLSWLTRLPSIQYLDFGGVNLSAVLDWPHVMNMLPFLRVLRLSDCSLTSVNQSLPRLMNLTNLEELDASWNSFDHPMVTSWFWNITSLKYLYLGYTSMYGQFPDALGDMASLQVLDLSGQSYYYNDNAKYRIMNTDLNNLCNLEVLNLDSALLYGDVAELFRNLPSCSPNKLQELHLGSNQLTGHIPPTLCKFQTLIELRLSNNFLEGELPSCLGVMEEIEYLALSNNNMSGEFPSFVQKFTNLLFLYLSRNKFSGRLPMWIGKLTRLRILRLSQNNFFGNIPVSISNLACLQDMDISNNNISGSLSSYLANMKTMRKTYITIGCYVEQELNYGSSNSVSNTSITSIDLSSNKLTGEIPEEIVVLDALVNLNLSRNHLSGGIPINIGQMQLLKSLDLSRNNLSGAIPPALLNMASLSYLDLSYNYLTGIIPWGSQPDFLYGLYPYMYVGNVGLCGYPLKNSCTDEGGGASKQGDEQGIPEEVHHGIQFFYIGFGCGFVLGTWTVFIVLLFKKSWRIACFQLPEKLYDRVYVLVAIWARRTQTDYHG